MLQPLRNMLASNSLVQGREWLLAAGPAALLILAAFWLALRFVPPAPPKVVTITTGGEAGAYYAFGKRYAEILKQRFGVDLQVRASAGSVENLRRLADPGSGVSIALLQGGIGNAQEAPDLVSIGRVFHEPLWVFYRGPDMDRLSALQGKRIAVGPEGSGTRVLAAKLLNASGVAEPASRFSPLTAKPAVDAMLAGQLDAVVLALAPQAPLIQELLRLKEVKLMSFAQGDAYTKVYPYLAKLTLPQGVFDLAANVPDRDVSLIGPQAALVVRKDLHPAIVALLAEAAQEVHGKAGLFNKAGEFPSQYDPDFEMDGDALRFYKSGPTFWKRVLPYALANFVERTQVLLVPLLTVLLPLMKAVPWLYRYRIRRRVLYWYRQLKDLEEKVAGLPRGADTTALRSEVERIDQAISLVPAPIAFAEQFYNLRTHVDLVRQRLAMVGTAA